MSDDQRYDQRPEFRALDDAISAWNTADAPGKMLTGWVLVMSTLNLGEQPEGTTDTHAMRYIDPPAQTYHHTLGLLTDAQNVILNAGSSEEGE